MARSLAGTRKCGPVSPCSSPRSYPRAVQFRTLFLGPSSRTRSPVLGTDREIPSNRWAGKRNPTLRQLQLPTLASVAGLVALFLSLAMPSNAQQYTVSVNGTPLNLSPEPIERGGRLFVPLRRV